jgi:hypothetical protein
MEREMEPYKPRMLPWKYRTLLRQFIAVADSGKYDSLGIEEVSRHVAAGTLFAFLVDRFGSDLDLSPIEPQDWSSLCEEWSGFGIDIRREFGVEKKGICLLMAYALQSIQSAEAAAGR